MTRMITVVGGLILTGGMMMSCSPGPLPSTASSPLPAAAVFSPLPTVIPAFSSTAGAVMGHVILPESWTSAKAYLAPFYPDETGLNGFYVLEPSIHRSVEVRPDGYFQVSDLEPGKYVIVVGLAPEDARAIADGSQPRVFTVEAGKLLDIGDVQLLSQ